MNKKIVIHYDEIALKGANRRIFENALVSNLRRALRKGELAGKVVNSFGRIFIVDFDQDSERRIENILKKTPGLVYFGLAFANKRDVDELLKPDMVRYFVERVGSESFRVSARRHDKSFYLTSQEVERMFADKMFETNPNLTVSLKNFVHEVKIEILHDEILIYIKQSGVGGLPVGSSGNTVLMLSAGFDSPVAGFMMMKRGAKIYPIHFHASEKTGREAAEAVKDISHVLSNYQVDLSLSLVNVLDIQKYIAANVKEKNRIIHLRRSFARMSAKYAATLNVKALVSGDSLGQVASQTLENISATSQSVGMPILRPLIGFNKNEIIKLAQKIGTADISARDCEDTCALFVPKKPQTKAKMEEIEAEDAELHELEKMENEALKKMETYEF